MSYTAAIAQLNSLVPELYATAGQPRRRFSVDEVRILLDALGNPHQHFQSVLIAGTNGKGSTASTLASILSEAGLRTGLYTSPHLERPNERIRLGHERNRRRRLCAPLLPRPRRGQQLLLSGRLAQLPSYFEILTALAFLYFAENKVDVAVLEVGMGGRLDATNVVDPLLSIVTDISLDHMEWLGPTISAIAREKAGILRPGGTMITLPQHPEANQVLGEVATELGVRGVSAVPYVPAAGTSGPYTVDALGATIKVDSPLAGAHQQRNIALAIAAAVELAERHAFPDHARRNRKRHSPHPLAGPPGTNSENRPLNKTAASTRTNGSSMSRTTPPAHGRSARSSRHSRISPAAPARLQLPARQASD